MGSSTRESFSGSGSLISDSQTEDFTIEKENQYNSLRRGIVKRQERGRSPQIPATQSLDGLEKMLDKFEQVYTEKKNNLYIELRLSENLQEKRRVLNDFFESIEKETSRI